MCPARRVAENPESTSADPESEGRVAVAKRSPFNLASFRLPAMSSTALLTEEESQSVQRVAQVDAQDLDLPTDGVPLDRPNAVESEAYDPETASNQLESAAAPRPAVAPNGLVDPDVFVAPASSVQRIDLASAFGMAGGNAWTIQLARQRAVDAHADLTAAKALWLLTLQLGVGWNKHDGRRQETEGNIVEASRGSFFAGGGATLGTPLAGGSNGPLRLSANLAIADAYFGPQIANRQVRARRAGISAAKNTALRDAGIAYIDLLEAVGTAADAQNAIEAANEWLQLTRTFSAAGAVSSVDGP